MPERTRVRVPVRRPWQKLKLQRKCDLCESLDHDDVDDGDDVGFGFDAVVENADGVVVHNGDDGMVLIY